MKISVIIGGAEYESDLRDGRDVSIPLRFDGPQPNVFGAARASRAALRAGAFVGDVREGGSCNCDEYSLTAHGNGTHTECVGHITAERIGVAERLRELLIPCTLISVRPVDPAETDENYLPRLDAGDRVITAAELKRVLDGAPAEFLEGLVVRTLPNEQEKLERDYADNAFPFFTNEGMAVVRSLGVNHLLVDMPSVDRAADEGRLSNHRIFWEVKGDGPIAGAESTRTITEMVYVPDVAADGRYLAAIQIPHFMTDAAPSRVTLFTLTERRRDE